LPPLSPKHIGVAGFSADPMTGWCQETFQAAKKWEKGIRTKDILIMILHPHLKVPILGALPIAGYLVKSAFPIKWATEALNSTSNDALQETIGMGYREIQRLAVPPV
jgi:hypothetical protein